MRRISRLRERTQRLLKGYIDNLTIHGATKILTGSIIERIFWAVISFGILGYFFYSANALLFQYLSNEIIVNNESVSVAGVKLPAVTVCDTGSFTCSGMLYKNKSLHASTCDPRKLAASQNQFKKAYWCWEANQLKYTKKCNHTVLQNHPGCLTFNPLQTITQDVSGRHQKARFVVRPTNNKSVFLFLHNTNEVPSWVNRHQYTITSTGFYNVIIQQRDIKRLQAPFKSKCSFNGNLKKYGFPYSKSLCQDSCYSRDMIDKCGTVTDLWWQYLPSYKREADTKFINKSIKENNKRCLWSFLSGSPNRKPCECISPCQETMYEAAIKKSSVEKIYIYLTIYVENLEIMKTNELAAYDSTRFLADMGGLIGLLIGMSLLSVFEVLVCLGLYTFDKLCLLLSMVI